MRKATFFTASRDPKSLRVQDVMEHSVWTVEPAMKASAVVHLLAERRIGSVPVVENGRTLVGLIGEFDLLRVLDQGGDLGRVEAKDIMTTDVITTTEESLIGDVIHLLKEQHLIRVPVVRGRQLVGIVARQDLLFGYVRATAGYVP